MFNCLEPLSDVSRWGLGTRGTQTSDLEDREGRNSHEYQERGKKHSWFHLLQALVRPQSRDRVGAREARQGYTTQ